MARKAWELDAGERTVNTGNPDVLLGDAVSARRRKQIERQDQIDEAEHKAKIAKLKKEETSAEAAVEKTEKKEETGGFKVTGGVNLGTYDLQQQQKQAQEMLEKLRKEADDAARATGQENQQLRDKIHEQEMKVLSTSFEAALAAVKEKLESKGTIAEQIVSIRAMAKELGMTQPAPGASDPAFQIQMLQLQHAEAQREREFQWQMQKDREAREDRQAQLRDERDATKAKLALEEKKTEYFRQAPKTIGTFIGRAIVEGGGAETEAPVTSKARQRYELEVPIGTGGKTNCPKCQTEVGVGPTARSAICANCDTKIFIKRISPEAAPEPERAEADEE